MGKIAYRGSSKMRETLMQINGWTIPRLFVGALIVFSFESIVLADEPPAPPTDPSIAVDIGVLGIVPPGQNTFRSTYDSGRFYVGTKYFPQLWYKFSSSNGEAPYMQFRRWADPAQGPYPAKSSYRLYNLQRQLLGDLTDTSIPISPGATYLIAITAPAQASAHFALEIRPALDRFSNDGGRSQQMATPLGVLDSVINHAYQFYTYFTRASPNFNDTSPKPGVLAPNYNSPDPAVSHVYYSFDLLKNSEIELATVNGNDDSFISHPKGATNGTVIKGRGNISLESGTYILEIFDGRTSIIGNVGGRDSTAETFENRTFQLKIKF
jgi:hypothetical protein